MRREGHIQIDVTQPPVYGSRSLLLYYITMQRCMLPPPGGPHDRAVLAGDHLQLPPTIISDVAASKGLGRTLFERLQVMPGTDEGGISSTDEGGISSLACPLAPLPLSPSLQVMYGDSISAMLTVQYRMHTDIMQWSSDELYEVTSIPSRVHVPFDPSHPSPGGPLLTEQADGPRVGRCPHARRPSPPCRQSDVQGLRPGGERCCLGPPPCAALDRHGGLWVRGEAGG